MEYPIWVIGIGPGHPDYLLPIAARKIEGCDFLVGGPRALQMFEHLHKETKVIDNNLGNVLEYIKEKRCNGTVAVLASGDPGFYGILNYLSKHFSSEELNVIPGVSSVQLAFAALKLPWQESALASLHGRPLSKAAVLFKQYPLTALLTDTSTTPAQLANCLEEQELSQAEVYICSNLSYPDEQICRLSVSELRQTATFNNCVVVIKRDL